MIPFLLGMLAGAGLCVLIMWALAAVVWHFGWLDF